MTFSNNFARGGLGGSCWLQLNIIIFSRKFYHEWIKVAQNNLFLSCLVLYYFSISRGSFFENSARQIYLYNFFTTCQKRKPLYFFSTIPELVITYKVHRVISLQYLVLKDFVEKCVAPILISMTLRDWSHDSEILIILTFKSIKVI